MTTLRALRKRRSYYRNRIKRQLAAGATIDDLRYELGEFRRLDRELTIELYGVWL